ncbi:MAG: hypothetical protein IT376_05825 [Polyangiaceae bacterium]|nr:hypothetical protein [Polyangiaceae bacterium]
MRTRERPRVALVVALLLAAAAPGALAQPAAGATGSVEGAVVALEEGELIVDLSSATGAAVGDRVELWRKVQLRHPVTGRPVADRFRIGTLELLQVGAQLSLARPDGALSRKPAPGDVVVLPRRAAAPAPAGSETPAPPSGVTAAPAPDAAAATPALDADATAVSRLFDGLRGAPLVARIRAYEDYVRAHPRGRYAVVLFEEAAALRRLLEPTETAGLATTLALRSHEAPRSVLARAPVTVGVELTGEPVGAVLHARASHEPAYRSVPMRPTGGGYWAATLPADRVTGPRLQYFVEATRADGTAVAVVGRQDAPIDVRVDERPTVGGDGRSRNTASVSTDYADYNRGRGNDVAWQTEGVLGMRLRDVGVRAVRSGFGVYRGVGGSVEELDERGLAGRSVGLTYGYLETELGLSRLTGLGGRLVLGLEDDGLDGGFQLSLRVGSDLETNLLLGGEVLGGVGLRGFTQLDLRAIERVPMSFRVEVTNQPAGTSSDRGDTDDDEAREGSEVGARAIAQVGYVVAPGLELALRGSYQGRTIRHAGPGIGGAVGFSW